MIGGSLRLDLTGFIRGDCWPYDVVDGIGPDLSSACFLVGTDEGSIFYFGKQRKKFLLGFVFSSPPPIFFIS